MTKKENKLITKILMMKIRRSMILLRMNKTAKSFLMRKMQTPNLLLFQRGKHQLVQEQLFQRRLLTLDVLLKPLTMPLDKNKTYLKQRVRCRKQIKSQQLVEVKSKI